MGPVGGTTTALWEDVNDDLLLAPAHLQWRKLAEGELTSAGLYERTLERAREFEHLNAFARLEEQNGHEAARRSTWRYSRGTALSICDGLPIALKDSLMVRASVGREGSKTMPDEPDEDDGPVVGALRRGGFVPAGRTTMPEFGWKAVTDSPVYGVTRNPWKTELTPGGSSGGNAVAVATGAASLAIGTDIGGSIRIPAAFCGIVGFKPTQDRAPKRPGSHRGVLSREGPMARTVLDCIHAIHLTEQRGPQDRPTTSTYPEPTNDIAYDDLIGTEVSILLDHPDLDVDRAIAKAVRTAGQAFKDLGCRVEEIDRQSLNFGGLRECYDTLYAGDICRNTAHLSPSERELLDPGLRALTERIEKKTIPHYVAAESERLKFLQAANVFFHAFDLLILPTVALSPFEVGRDVPKGWADPLWTSWAGFTWPLNLTGQPALSIPIGFTDEGLPIGGQIVAARGRDRLVLSAGHLLEQLLALDVASRLRARLRPAAA